jgi:predicted Holliday junction resolvase-like endonuclease
VTVVALIVAVLALLVALVSCLLIGSLVGRIDERADELEEELRADFGDAMVEHAKVEGLQADALERLSVELLNVAKLADAIRQVSGIACPHGIPLSLPCETCADDDLARAASRN